MARLSTVGADPWTGPILVNPDGPRVRRFRASTGSPSTSAKSVVRFVDLVAWITGGHQ